MPNSKPLVTIITATPLTNHQRQSIVGLLEGKIGHDVQIQEQVDEEVLGGILVKIGDETFDATISGKLKKIESVLPQIQIVTPIELNSQTTKRLSDKIKTLYGDSVDIQILVNPKLLGGIQVRYGSQEYDSSVKTKLDKLHLHLSQAIAVEA